MYLCDNTFAVLVLVRDLGLEPQVLVNNTGLCAKSNQIIALSPNLGNFIVLRLYIFVCFTGAKPVVCRM